jgi:probable HAF family extracellular repeat protein
MKRSILSVLTIVLACGSFSAAATYQVIDLGELGTFFGDLWRPLQINDNGEVCGTAPSDMYFIAFLWDQDNGITYAPTSDGAVSWSSGINNSTVLIGAESYGFSATAFYWDENMLMYLDSLPGLDSAEATGINEAGEISGYVEDPQLPGIAKAVIWIADEIVTIPRLDPTHQFNLANAINNNTQVVGYSGYSDTKLGFLWSGGQLQDLGLIENTTSTVPTAINDAAKIVGYAVNPANQKLAFLWQNDTIAPLETIGQESKALGLNEELEIVGSYTENSLSYACIWINGALNDLNTMIEQNGWTLREAQDINEDGWIVGIGTNPDGLANHGFLLISQEQETLEAEIDIDPDSFNLQSNIKWLTCSIWPPEGYTIYDIDLDSIQLNGSIAPDKVNINEWEQKVVAKFPAADVRPLLAPDETELTIIGELNDGQLFQGADIIKVKAKNK